MSAQHPVLDITIEQDWKGFANSVLPGDLYGEGQRREMRRAFFAGYHSMLVNAKALGQVDDEQEAMRWLDDRWNECEKFIADVIAGRG